MWSRGTRMDLTKKISTEDAKNSESVCGKLVNRFFEVLFKNGLVNEEYESFLIIVSTVKVIS